MVDLIRAPLFVPATRPDRFAKAAASDADAIILDLEDAVSSQDKDTARASLNCDFTDKPVIVRINGIGTRWHSRDVAAIEKLSVSAIMLPKSETAHEISALYASLGGQTPIIALIETAKGIANARVIAELEGVVRLAFGSIDYCADLGCAHQRDVLLPVRSELVLASRLAGIAAPIDGVTAQLDDPEKLEQDTKHARSLGMTGKLCIHPKQVSQVRKTFAPSQEEISWARRVLGSGDGAVLVDGQMVDEPVRIRARSILASLTENGLSNASGKS
ncbi:MAG: CoA ester lyase [Pseudomonadota bacterium]